MTTNRQHILESATLRLRFFWRGDRWAHEIWLPANGDWRRALASVEGSPDDDWPPSPPLQSLEVENRAGLQTALLVGMAGHSHWSASAQLDPEVPSVHFDVACRLRGASAGPLGSGYAVAGPIDVELDDRFAPLELERDAESLRIAVRPAADFGPRTVRWAYRLAARGDSPRR